MLTLGSLFDGLGGWLLAAQRNGVKPLWGSEVNELCCDITATHFPDVAQLGDIKHINNPPYVDIITAGSPCQDLSIAGQRKGLGGERSGLFFNAIRIVRAVKPRYFAWENVPGAFSSNDGRDFQTVLSAITATDIPLPQCHRWSNAGMVNGDGCQVAWRVLDAQYWGVPQRRRRIFLIASFRDQCAAEILFEPESLPGHIGAGQTARQDDTRTLAVGTGSSIGFNGGVSAADSFPTLNEQTPPIRTTTPVCVMYDNHPQDGRVTERNTVASAVNTHYGTGGNNVPLVMPRAYTQQTYSDYALTDHSNALRAKGANYGGGSETLIAAHTVRRLTPLECERLQGLPDNWTLITGKHCTDAARYKAIGNAMAQPCADFVISRIVERTVDNAPIQEV